MSGVERARVHCNLPFLILYFHFQGVRFDPDASLTLRLEFARSNTKVSKPVNKQAVLAPHFFPREPQFSELMHLIVLLALAVVGLSGISLHQLISLYFTERRCRGINLIILFAYV